MSNVITLDRLVEILAADPDPGPLDTILVDDTWDHARSLFERVTHRLRVRQKWSVNGTRRAELDNGNLVRLASASSRNGLRGRSADFVVMTSAAFAIGNVLDDARLVVAASPRGRVAVL
jgi:hypothetical protein